MLIHKDLLSTVSQDPTELPRALAAAALEHPTYFDDGVGVAVVLRTADLDSILRDEQTFSTRVFDQGLMKDALIATSGDEHRRMRKLYNSFFAPQKIRRYEESIVAPAVDRVLDALAEVEAPDLIDHFSMQVPQQVVSALFGLPAERIADNDVLVRRILISLVRPFDRDAVAAGEAAYAEMSEELHAIAKRELDDPSDTLLGEIAKALIDADMGTVEACERIVFTLILGSYETTIWGLASTMAALLSHPETMARIRADLSLLPNAIEESWRWCGSTAGTVRFVEKPTTLAGHEFEAGSVIQLGWLAAHYDSAVYDKPELFDIERKAKTMIFGGGAHYCVGAPLARMETRVAVSRLLERWPELRFDPERPPPNYHVGARGSVAFGPDNLPVVLG